MSDSKTPQRWKPRIVSAALLRLAIFLVPLAVGWTVGSFVAQAMGVPSNGWEVAGWWAVVVATASGAATLTDTFSRRLLPITVLMKMTMLFPDQAPSRLKVARRSGNLSELRRRATEGDESIGRSAEVILSLAAALSLHDRRTRGHSERTRAYTDMLAEEMGLSRDDRDRLRWAALLHDVGKLRVPAEILNKPGPLTPEDWLEVHKHPVHGMALIEPIVSWLGPWAKTVEDHHEQWDGSGYPHQLSGTDISLGARIVAVADAFDVMTSGRSYQPARTPAVARREIAALSGKQFDPDVVRALMNVSLGKLRWATGPIAFLAEMPFIRGIPQFGRDAAVLLTSSAVMVTAAAAAPLPFDVEVPHAPAAVVVDSTTPPTTLLSADATPTTSTTISGSPPVAVADAATTEEDTAVVIDVIANDRDPDGDLRSWTLTITAIPRLGTAVAGAGVVVYTPGKDLFGEDRFSYRICDSGQRCSGAAVDVTVVSVNDPPTVEPISTSTPQNTVLTYDLGFSDPDGDALACRLSTPPTAGAATVPADCSRLTFSPSPSFTGIAGLEIAVSDGTIEVLVPVTVDVVKTNSSTTTTTTTTSPPAKFNPIDDSVTVQSGKNLVFDPTVNDSAGLKKTVSIVTEPQHGESSVVASGNIRYEPDDGFVGIDTLVYRVCIPDGTCGTATVTIAVR